MYLSTSSMSSSHSTARSISNFRSLGGIVQYVDQSTVRMGHLKSKYIHHYMIVFLD